MEYTVYAVLIACQAACTSVQLFSHHKEQHVRKTFSYFCDFIMGVSIDVTTSEISTK